MVIGFPKHINSKIRKNKTEKKGWSEVDEGRDQAEYLSQSCEESIV